MTMRRMRHTPEQIERTLRDDKAMLKEMAPVTRPPVWHRSLC